MSEIDKDMREVDTLKQRKSFLKNECDKLEEEVNAARREVGTVAKELQSANKHIGQLETQVEAEQAKRHSFLIQCKLDNIAIPMKKGNLEEVDEDQSEDPSIEVSGSQPSHIIYERVSSDYILYFLFVYLI